MVWNLHAVTSIQQSWVRNPKEKLVVDPTKIEDVLIHNTSINAPWSVDNFFWQHQKCYRTVNSKLLSKVSKVSNCKSNVEVRKNTIQCLFQLSTNEPFLFGNLTLFTSALRQMRCFELLLQKFNSFFFISAVFVSLLSSYEAKIASIKWDR